MADSRAVFKMLELWFEYIKDCRARGIHFDDAEAVDVLRYNRHEEDVVFFLIGFETYLERRSAQTPCNDA